MPQHGRIEDLFDAGGVFGDETGGGAGAIHQRGDVGGGFRSALRERVESDLQHRRSRGVTPDRVRRIELLAFAAHFRERFVVGIVAKAIERGGVGGEELSIAFVAFRALFAPPFFLLVNRTALLRGHHDRRGDENQSENHFEPTAAGSFADHDAESDQNEQRAERHHADERPTARCAVDERRPERSGGDGAELRQFRLTDGTMIGGVEDFIPMADEFTRRAGAELGAVVDGAQLAAAPRGETELSRCKQL